MPTIPQLPELTTPAGGDLLAIIDDPAGSPITKKITVTNLLSLAAGGDPLDAQNIIANRVFGR